MQTLKTNFFWWLNPIVAVLSFYYGATWVDQDPKIVFATLLGVSLLAFAIETLGNKAIHAWLDKAKRERRAVEKKKMLTEYAELINKAKPRDRKVRPSKRKKR